VYSPSATLHAIDFFLLVLVCKKSAQRFLKIYIASKRYSRTSSSLTPTYFFFLHPIQTLNKNFPKDDDDDDRVEEVHQHEAAGVADLAAEVDDDGEDDVEEEVEHADVVVAADEVHQVGPGHHQVEVVAASYA
jgi:hypothetical protein